MIARRMARLSLFAAWFLLSAFAIPAAAAPQSIVIDAAAPARAFPHYWERVIGSGRAAIALRASYLRHLDMVKSVSSIGYVRFHAMFHDELGVYSETKSGAQIYNFQYLDQIYDGLRARGLRPFVELSFMPKALAEEQILQSFWYRPNISPPKSYDKWDALIAAYARHIIARYGIDEVSHWYFEVWNEPNLGFWKGRPAEQSYFELYDHTARALKAVSARLRVGGPATAQLAWIGDFIAHTKVARVPVDFISSHIYGDDPVENVLGRRASVPSYGLVCPGLQRAHDEIARSSRPDLPLIVTEFNATWRIDNPLLRAVALGPWLARTIAHCDGLTQAMSFWTFSDDFEEPGVLREPLQHGFGLIGLDGIPKPVFAAFSLLHKLGDERLPVPADILVTRRPDHSLALLVWNWQAPRDPPRSLQLDLAFKNLAADAKARISRLDAGHGDTTRLYEEMGSPVYPSAAQVAQLQKAAVLTSEPLELTAARLHLVLPPNGMALVEIGR